MEFPWKLPELKFEENEKKQQQNEQELWNEFKSCRLLMPEMPEGEETDNGVKEIFNVNSDRVFQDEWQR